MADHGPIDVIRHHFRYFRRDQYPCQGLVQLVQGEHSTGGVLVAGAEWEAPSEGWVV